MIALLMKKLVVDISAEDIHRTTMVLEENGLNYEVRTKRSRGHIGSAFDAHTYAKANLAMYKKAAQPTFVCSVYVKPKDFALAKKLTR